MNAGRCLPTRISTSVKSSAIVRNGTNGYPHVNTFCARTHQHFGALRCRGTGGHNIIDQSHVSRRCVKPMPVKSTTNVTLALFPVQTCLCSRITLPAKTGSDEGNPQRFAGVVSQLASLVESAFCQSYVVKRYWNQTIRKGELSDRDILAQQMA